jgi:curved DNA-binding protein
MAFIDYYKIMGVPKDTPQEKIRAAYLRRTKQFHPDLHPEDPKAKAKFQALQEANAVLSDPEKRAKYDRYGERWEQADAFERAGGGGGAAGGGFSGFDFSGFTGAGGGAGGFSSFFEDLFGGAARTRRGGCAGGCGGGADTSGDANVTVDIDLYTAMLGGDIVLQTHGGRLRLRVKPETQNGAKVRLRGKGYQRPDGTYGSLIVTYRVRLPEGLNDRQRDLLRQMRAAGA